jgi:hypothetical protein
MMDLNGALKFILLTIRRDSERAPTTVSHRIQSTVPFQYWEASREVECKQLDMGQYMDFRTIQRQ